MLLETDWLKMLVDRAENKSCVIRTDQIFFGHRGIVIFTDKYFFFIGATAPCGPGLSRLHDHTSTHHTYLVGY